MLFKAMGMNEITWGERPRKCLRSESAVPGEGWRLRIPQLNMGCGRSRGLGSGDGGMASTVRICECEMPALMQLEISRRCSQMCARELRGDGSSWPHQPPGTSNCWNG